MEKEMNQGFRYTLEREKIAEYRKLTAEQKLQWLEDIQEFTEATLTEETRRIRDHFHNGPTQKTDSQ